MHQLSTSGSLGSGKVWMKENWSEFISSSTCPFLLCALLCVLLHSHCMWRLMFLYKENTNMKTCGFFLHDNIFFECMLPVPEIESCILRMKQDYVWKVCLYLTRSTSELVEFLSSSSIQEEFVKMIIAESKLCKTCPNTHIGPEH